MFRRGKFSTEPAAGPRTPSVGYGAKQINQDRGKTECRTPLGTLQRGEPGQLLLLADQYPYFRWWIGSDQQDLRCCGRQSRDRAGRPAQYEFCPEVYFLTVKKSVGVCLW